MRQSPTDALVNQVESSLFRLRPPQALLISFIALSMLGAVLLKVPIASTQPTSWQQAIFMSVSTATVTGLAVVDIGTHFTLFGQWVLIVLMQLHVLDGALLSAMSVVIDVFRLLLKPFFPF